MPIHASYFPIEINVSKNYGTDIQLTGFTCLNATDNNVYCYLKTYDRIYRYNSTWGDEVYCTANEASIGNFYMTNDTTLFFSSGSSCTAYNITNISAGGTCTVQASYLSDYCTGTSASTTFVSSISKSQAYLRDRVINQNGQYAEAAYWNFAYELSVPDKNSNTTLIVANTSSTSAHTDFQIYNNRILSGSAEDPMTLWNIGNTTGTNDGYSVYCSVVDTEGTSWAYCVDINTNSVNGFETDYVYKVNFDTVVDYTSAEFYAREPLNDTYKTSDSTYILQVYLSTDLDGTLVFDYDDENVWYIPINDSNRDVHYYSVTVPTEYGSHFWIGQFNENTTIQYSTGQIFYTISSLTAGDLATNPAEALALAFGSIFSIKDLATAKMMFSVVMAFAMSFMTLIFLHKLKVHGDINGQAFMVSLLLWIVMFSLVGWFPSWILVVIMVIAGLVVARNLGIGG